MKSQEEKRAEVLAWLIEMKGQMRLVVNTADVSQKTLTKVINTDHMPSIRTLDDLLKAKKKIQAKAVKP